MFPMTPQENAIVSRIAKMGGFAREKEIAKRIENFRDLEPYLLKFHQYPGYRYPLFQFTRGNKPLPRLTSITEPLLDYDDWHKIEAFITPSVALEGLTVAEALRNKMPIATLRKEALRIADEVASRGPIEGIPLYVGISQAAYERLNRISERDGLSFHEIASNCLENLQE